MPDFRHAPSFVPASILQLSSDGAAWVAELPDGSTMMLARAEMASRARPVVVDGDGFGWYAVRDPGAEPARYEVDHRAGVVSVEGAQGTVPVEEFVRSALRVDSRGRPVCAFMASLQDQWQALTEAGEHGHLTDLRDFAEAARLDGARKHEVAMYDLVSSGIGERLSAFDAMVEASRVAGDGPVDFFTADGAGGPFPWIKVSQHQHFGIPQVRAMFRQLLEPLVGEDRAFGDVMTSTLPEGGIEELHDRFMGLGAEWVGTQAPFTAPNVLPGYATTAPRHYRVDGMDVVTFEDFQGAYAYAWPTPPSADEDEEPAKAPGV